LSDLHVTTPDAPFARFANGAANLEAAIAHLNGLDRRPDLVVVTGDLVNDGTIAEYTRLRALLDPLESPVLLLLGNHDEPEGLRAVFSEHNYLPERRPAHWVVDDYELRLVAVDTTLDERHDGAVGPQELDWLRATLDAAPADRPTLLLMHHPPFVTGMWWMDYGGLKGAAALHEVVAARANVVGVLAGHVHRPFHTTIGSALVSSAPAIAYQSCLALTDDSPPLVSDVAAPIPLVWWTGERLLGAHTDYRLPQHTMDLRTVIPNWDDYQRRARSGDVIPKDH
jgi:3',5'-cyclic AMP phosphodiesterase CpdA